MTEDIVQTSSRHVDEVRTINQDLTEKALHMRCMGYLAQVKARLLTETIFEIDASKKILLHTNQETARQREIIARQKIELEQKNKELAAFSYSVQQRLLLHREQTPLGAIEWNTDFEITDWNPSAERIFGFTRDEAIGRPLANLLVAEKIREETKDAWHALMTNKQALHQTSENITREGKTRLCEWYNTPLVSEDDKVIGMASLVDDITERRQTEEALRRSQKMEILGQLSGGIAHDFNNQLGVIIGYLHFLKDHFPEDDEPRQWVDSASKATLHCIELTRQLLTFSRRQGKEKNVLDLNTTLKELKAMITRSLTPEVEVQYFLANDLWSTKINAGEFQDVLLNLVINARDAMPDGGTLLIETSNKILNADYIDLNPGDETREYVQLRLNDTGTGMDQETLEQIFEPFFTTKPKGKGTGLGMAMAYDFAKRYGGHIKVNSTPGVGTGIHLFLPRSSASEPTMIVDDEEEAKLPTGNENILIVEDETDLLQLADQYLTNLGYRTHVAKNAAQALTILAGDEQFDLLFSDVVMPGGMNGYDLAEQATRQQPHLKVLLTSGFTSKTTAHHHLARFAAQLLSKPYRKTDLAQRIRLVLDASPLKSASRCRNQPLTPTPDSDT